MAERLSVVSEGTAEGISDEIVPVSEDTLEERDRAAPNSLSLNDISMGTDSEATLFGVFGFLSFCDFGLTGSGSVMENGREH